MTIYTIVERIKCVNICRGFKPGPGTDTGFVFEKQISVDLEAIGIFVSVCLGSLLLEGTSSRVLEQEFCPSFLSPQLAYPP